MTYSIVARDPDTHALGVAVQTCNLAVGTWVPWAEAGVGAVATQAVAERTYGTLGLDLIAGRKTPQEALEALLAVDPRREFRQVAIVDRHGRVATHTGKRCLSHAGGRVGDAFSVQANMMARDTVWDAMAAAFENASGDFAERLLAALDAAEAEGGDIRGRRTAALLIVGPERATFPLVDLRVDHHPDPLAELRRLLQLHRAYTAEYEIPKFVDKGQLEAAHEAVNNIRRWAPDEPYLHYLSALHLAGPLNRREEALSLLRSLVEEQPVWLEYLRRDAAVNHFGQPGVSASLLEQLRKEKM
ncbi:MAG: DUF1028 domain-containing protein [Candidatus Promineifilaceae bacterium]|nr:DUF1028 domain-containing protein [Candidatus Promineifilaceae bacterium]